jgi:membrane protease YdiL (CAAX protease family)
MQGGVFMEALGFGLHAAIILYLILVEPFWGKRKYVELSRSVGSDPTARSRFYTWILLLEWGLVLVAGIGLALQGNGLDWLGFRSPTSEAAVIVPAVMAGAGVGLILPVIAARFLPKVRESIRRQIDPLGPMLPTPGRERWLFAAVSVTAGICEEVLFRGLLIGWVDSLLPGLPYLVLGLISAVVFGLGHLYQGWKGVLGTGLLGGLFAALFLLTRSLYLPIIIHALIDLRMLAMLWAVEGRP